MSENLDPVLDEKPNWFQRNKEWFYPILMLALGIFGSNADRIWEYLPESPVTVELQTKVEDLDARVTEMENDDSANQKLLEMEELLKELYENIDTEDAG
jgi:hypothetical protein